MKPLVVVERVFPLLGWLFGVCREWAVDCYKHLSLQLPFGPGSIETHLVFLSKCLIPFCLFFLASSASLWLFCSLVLRSISLQCTWVCLLAHSLDARQGAWSPWRGLPAGPGSCCAEWWGRFGLKKSHGKVEQVVCSGWFGECWQPGFKKHVVCV